MDIQALLAILLPILLASFEDVDEETAIKQIRDPNRIQKLVVKWTLRRKGFSRSEIKEVFQAQADLTDEDARELLEAAKEK
jgi:SOS response regulatory protein OraA/RecX